MKDRGPSPVFFDTVELLSKNGEQVYSSSFVDKNNNPAPQIKYSKKINGTYYVVEAAFENSYKKMWVQSVYLENNKEAVTQASAEGINTNHKANAQSALVSPTSNNTVPQTAQSVNTNISTKAENNTDMKKYWADVIEQQRSAEAQSDAETSVLQSSAKVGERIATPTARNDGARGFRDSSDKEIYRDPTHEESMETLTSERKNAKQRHITDVAKSLDSSFVEKTGDGSLSFVKISTIFLPYLCFHQII